MNHSLRTRATMVSRGRRGRSLRRRLPGGIPAGCESETDALSSSPSNDGEREYEGEKFLSPSQRWSLPWWTWHALSICAICCLLVGRLWLARSPPIYSSNGVSAGAGGRGDSATLGAAAGSGTELKNRAGLTRFQWRPQWRRHRGKGIKDAKGRQIQEKLEEQVFFKYFSLNEKRRGLLQELRATLASHPSLQRRARAVKHELDSDLSLMRYLELCFWKMECDGSPGGLVGRMEATIIWREEMWPSIEHNVPDAVKREGESGIFFVQGHDREGRPLIHFRPALLTPRGRSIDPKSIILLLIYTVERAVSTMAYPEIQFGVIVDCRGFGLGTLPPPGLVKDAFVLLMAHYPLRLGYVRMVHAGTPMSMFWNIVSTVLLERTRKKIAFVGGGDVQHALRDAISPEHLDILHINQEWSFDSEPYFSSNPLGKSIDKRK